MFPCLPLIIVESDREQNWGGGVDGGGAGLLPGIDKKRRRLEHEHEEEGDQQGQDCGQGQYQYQDRRWRQMRRTGCRSGMGHQPPGGQDD